MKKGVFVIALLCSLAANAQSTCGWYGTMPVEKRRAAYPFKDADRVVFISFFSSVYSSVVDSETGAPILANDSADVVNKIKIKVLRDFKLPILSDSRITNYPTIEMAELNQQEIDSLSRWYFNFKFKKFPKFPTVEPRGCYEPRNAVLFLDSSGKVMSFIEVCFYCSYYAIAPKDAAFNELNQMTGCFDKIDILREMFRKKGIKQGVDRS